MIEAFSTPKNRTRTFVLLAAGCALATGAAVTGITDNLSGIALALLSAGALILALVHPWRSVRRFRHLFRAAGMGVIALAALHILLDLLAARSAGSPFVHGVLGGVGAVSLLVALLICPPGLLIGAIGALAISLRERHSRKSAPVA